MSTTIQLHCAAKRGDQSAIQRALGKGANINLALGIGTPLMWAAGSVSAEVDVLGYLVERGADINVVVFPEEPRSALYQAAASGDIEKVKFLIDAGADVKRVHLGYLLHTFPPSKAPVIELLLKAGARFDSTVTVDGMTPERVAAVFADFESAHLLLKAGADPDYQEWTFLERIIAFGTKEELRHELEKLAPTERPKEVERVWDVAVCTGEVDKIELLTPYGGTPASEDLFTAVHRDNPEMVRWLLSLGADIEIRDFLGKTPLMQAAEWGSTRCVAALIAEGADIHALSDFNDQPINDAANPEIARLLVEAGAEIDYINGQGYNLLKTAVENENIELIDAALKLGANPNNERLARGQSPLHIAVSSEQYAVVKLLLQAGADPNLANHPDYNYPLQAVRSVETLQLLLKAGGNARLKSGFTGHYPIYYHTDPEIIAAFKKAMDHLRKKS